MPETNFRALCAELLQPLSEYDDANPYHEHCALITRARAALAQPGPVAPTDEEIMEVFWEHQSSGLEELWADDWPAAARAVLARWGTPANNTREEN
jgi:hypothetical protein